MNKKGQVTLFIVYIIAAVMIVLIAAVFAPMGVLFNSEMYLAGEQILLDANESIQSINDASVKTAVQGSLDSAIDSGQNNIQVNANIFQYSWIFILILTALVVFLYTRRLVEYGYGNFI